MSVETHFLRVKIRTHTAKAKMVPSWLNVLQGIGLLHRCIACIDISIIGSIIPHRIHKIDSPDITSIQQNDDALSPSVFVYCPYPKS